MIQGRTAVVTGASRGIGFEIARALVNRGLTVVITGRKKETIEKASKAIGKGAIPLTWDVSDIALAETKVEECAELLGGLDIFVNNAGIFARRSEWDCESLLSTTPEEWQIVMRTNTDALFFCMQAAVKYMRKHQIEGNILNVTSVAGNQPVYGAYGASKIAATGLTRGWGKMFASEHYHQRNRSRTCGNRNEQLARGRSVDT